MDKEIHLDKEVFHDLEAAQYEYERLKDILAFILSNNLYDLESEEFQKWEDKIRKAFSEYQHEKLKFERETIPNIFGDFLQGRILTNWALDFYSCTLTIEVENA